MPLFYGVEGLPSTFPYPTFCTTTSPVTYLDWAGRTAKGFVKLPLVISIAHRITIEPTHKHWYGHTLGLHAALLSSTALISALAAAVDGFLPASDESESNTLLHWLTRYSPFHRANFDEFFILRRLLNRKMFCQPVTITPYAMWWKMTNKFKWTSR